MRALLALLLVLLCAVPAAAQTGGGTTPLEGPTDPNAISKAEKPDVKPKDHRLTTLQAQAIGERDPKFRAERAKHRRSRVQTYLKGQTRWQVSLYAGRPEKEVAQVVLEDRTGRITESWTGEQVIWTMARGYPGAFGRALNAPWIWLPLTALFALGLAQRRLLCLRHLDLLVLTLFGVGYGFFNAARIGTSVAISTACLLYVLWRLLGIGLGRRDPGEPRPLVPAAWLGPGLLALIGFRIALNVVDSNVVDIGFAGVIGADRITDGDTIWGTFPDKNPAGDTYGPWNYLAYVPAELLLPWSGQWDSLPAAHLVAILADLACIGLLVLLGRRIRDWSTGLRLAFLWAACPFSVLALNTNSNDALLAAPLLAAILCAASGPARGAWLALAGWTKFVPLALGPLFLLHGRRDTRLPFVLAFAGVTVVSAALVLLWGDASRFLERTLQYQAGRDAPFSVWGQLEWFTAQRAALVLGVALAIGVALVPRRRDLVGLAALAGAVLVALQLGTSYWFYLYITWWLGPFLVAVTASPAPAARPTGAAPARSTPPVAVPVSTG